MCDLCDKTVFSGGRASLLPPAPFLLKRHDTHGATRLLGPRRTLYGRKGTTFSANGQKISLLFPSSARKTAFSTFEPRFSITFSGSSPDSHCGHTSYYRGIDPRRGGKALSPPPGSAAEAADGGARASSGGTSPRSPPGGGETPRDRSKATGGSPVSDATTRGIGGSGARESLNPPPESTAEAADGGAHASSSGTSPRSPPGGGETPRDQSAHNPRNRQVGCRGGSKSPRVPAPASGAAVAPPRPPTIDGASGQSVAKPRRGGADIRPREWPDAPPKRAVRAWPWAIVRSRREKTALPPCPRAGGRCGVNESMWTSGKNLT